MRQIVTTGIVLTRIEYGEADRIITMLTPDHGKISVVAKGVRRIKSKLAGGIELFSISQITFIPGRGDLGTLVSTRLQTHYGNIVKDLDRTMLAYTLLKRLGRATEDAAGAEYFDLLRATLVALDQAVHQTIVELWFDAQLLTLAGNQPNLTTDAQGKRLAADQRYTFDFDTMSFQPAEQGMYMPDHIKFLRLVFGLPDPAKLQQIQGLQKVLAPCLQLVSTARKQSIRI